MKVIKCFCLAIVSSIFLSTAFADGKQVYDTSCMVCHAAGVAGAPKVGDVNDWSARLSQGIEVIYDHAINGYQGEKGIMPPKGGFVNLSDDDVKAAVDYMLENSK